MSVAQSYAKALYETVAAEKADSSETLNRIESQMDQLTQLLNQSKEARVALFSPLTMSKEKVALIESIAKKMGVERSLSQFFCLLARKGRLSLIEEIRESFSSVRLSHEGGVAGRLVSAEPIDEADAKSLAMAFGQKLGKKVAFRSTIDPSLLAGMKVTVNGVTYDGTLRSQLQKLRDRFGAGFTGTA